MTELADKLPEGLRRPVLLMVAAKGAFVSLASLILAAAFERHGEGMGLSAITHVDGPPPADLRNAQPLVPQCGLGLHLEPAKYRVQRCAVDVGPPRKVGLREVVLDVGHQQPRGAEQAGHERDHDAPDPHRVRELHGVYRSAAAERDQREFTHAAPALRGNRLDRTRHRRIGDHVNAPRGVRDAASERRCDVLANCPRRALGVDRHGTAQQSRRAQVAEHDIRVGHGRLGAAQCVACRPRNGSGAARPHCDAADRVDRHHRAASRADLGNVDHRQLERVAPALRGPARRRHPGAHLVVARVPEPSALDQRTLRGGPAHVERNRVAATDAARQRRGGDGTCRRPASPSADGAHQAPSPHPHAAYSSREFLSTVSRSIR